MFLQNVIFVSIANFFLSAIIPVIAHSHGHAHNDEPPHLKYTREVNEAAKLEDEVEHVYHEQAHSHGHHSHDDEHVGHHHSHNEEHGSGSKRMANTHPKISTAAYNDQPYDKDSYLSFLNDPQTRLWTYAVGSTLLISAFPCFLLAFIPIRENTGDDSPLLRTLLAFGAGGLLGDAFLHLIPHATPSGHSHSHSHTGGGGHSHEPHDLSVGLWVLVGFMTFFIVEKFVRIVRGNDSPGHGHSHHHQKEEKAKKKLSDDEDEAEKSAQGMPKKKKVGEERDEEKSVKQPGRIRVAAYLNLVADFMHNFTDGLAIGASFVAGSTVGLVTMVTVLVHEVPHEIGDFAILVQSGFSKPRAMLIQLCTALGALAGCVLSLWDVDAAALAEAAEQSWAIPFTAGGFIYIGSVSMIPDLLEQSTAWQSVKEVCALLLGLAMMYAIAFFE